MIADPSQLGLGTYTVAEVARLVQMPYATANQWYRGTSPGGRHRLHSDYREVAGDFAVSFLDLIEANFVRQFRLAHVPFRTIRRAHRVLADKLGSEHPFAHSDLYTDGRNILVDTSEELGERALSDVIDQQGFFYEMKDRLKRISYDQVTKLASDWRIHDDVLIDPKIAFGKPAVVGTATRTDVIARQYSANDGDAGLIADLYSISEEQVLNAVRFERSLHELKAA